MPRETTRLVSVIIPTYNSARFVVQAVQGALEQSYRCYELIVIDDGSCDETRDVLQAFAGQITYVRQDNQGAAAARNAGVKLARGEYICFLDADDLWAPNKLELQTDFMEAHNDIGLVFADAEEWEGTEIRKASIVATMRFHAEVVSQIPLRGAFEKLVIENFIPTSSVMIRRACLVKAGLFDEDLQNSEDRDLWLRVAAHCDIACLPRVLARKRSHGANISERTEVTLRSRIRLWDRNRRRFPTLAAETVYDRLLAGTYQELGYIVLAKGEASGARACGMTSLRSAIRYVVATKSSFPYRWWLSLGLILLSLGSWPLVRFLWQARNGALGRSRRQWPSSAVASTEPRGLISGEVHER